VLLALFSALSAFGQAPSRFAPSSIGTTFFELRTYPFTPADSVPLWIEVATNDDLIGEVSPLVRRAGNTIQLIASDNPIHCNYPYCLDPPTHYLAADLGLLEAGSYRLEVYLPSHQPGEGLDLHFWTTFEVLRGPRISFIPEKPLAEDVVRIDVDFGEGTCPQVGQAELAGDLIVVPASLGDCSMVENSTTLPPLAAGTYPVQVVVDGQVFAHKNLEVLASNEPPWLGGRFELGVTWRNAAGATGKGLLVQEPSADSALFYFFSPANWELMVKVLDGCNINGHFWVFSAASTDVEFEVTVEDHQTARIFSFSNPLGRPAGAINNVEAFPCP